MKLGLGFNVAKGFSGGVELPDLLLDLITGATAAYDVDLLSKDYAGSAIRIRRSSDNAEQDIGFSGVLFDNASALSFIGGGTGFVTTLYDQSGNGNDLVQAVANNQPTLSSGLILGDGTADFLRNAASPQYAGDFTYGFWARSSTVHTNIKEPVAVGTSFTDNITWDYNDGINADFHYWNGSGGTRIQFSPKGGLTDTVWYHSLFTRSGTTMELKSDDVSKGTNTAGSSFTTALRNTYMGSGFDTFQWNGNISIFVQWGRKLTSLEETAFMDFNAKK